MKRRHMNLTSRKTAIALGLMLVFALSGWPAVALGGPFLPGHSGNQKEKVLLQTDRDIYLAGDILWFSLVYPDGRQISDVRNNKVAYVTLTDLAGISQLEAKIRVDSVLNSGSFYIPPSLPGGRYQLITYTSEIRNDPNAIAYTKQIEIINTLNRPQPSPTRVAASPLSLYPEGGVWLAGQPLKVAFTTTDTVRRKGITAHGFITNEKKDTLAKLESGATGIGLFSMSFKESESYFITMLFDNGTEQSFELPRSKTNKPALKLSEQSAKAAVLLVSGLSNASKSLKLKVYPPTAPPYELTVVPAAAGSTPVTLSREVTGAGLTRVCLLTGEGVLLSERLILFPADKKDVFSVSTDRNAYQTREKVALKIGQLQDTETDPLAWVSVSVTSTAPRQTGFIAGDLPAFAYFPYSETGSNTSLEEALLLRQACENMNQILPAAVNTQKAQEERGGHIVKAVVTDSWSNSPAAGIICTLTAPSYPFELLTATSDSAGIVLFRMRNYYGPGKIVLKTITKAKPNPYKITLVDPFLQRGDSQSSYLSVYHPELDSLELIRRSVAMQANNLFHRTELTSFIIPADTSRKHFFGKPEYSYELADYTRFSSMEEVMREFVLPVTVSLRNNHLSLTIYDEQYQRFYSENMLVLLDGVPLNDPDLIFEYDPLKVKKIDIVTRRYLLGSSAYFGIISVETIKGEFDAPDLEPSTLVVEYEGYQLKRKFYSPEYAAGQPNDTHIPDMRSTLLWLPNLAISSQAEKEISFYTSDFPGSFEIKVTGITASGRPVSGTGRFDVR